MKKANHWAVFAEGPSASAKNFLCQAIDFIKQSVYICSNKSTKRMELQVLVSKKGTKVVRASELYQVLELPVAQYARNLKTWLSDVYEFRDGIRKPVKMQDFATRPVKDQVMDDYYFSVEMAKLITLNSHSRVKQKYARYLFSLEERVENAELLTKEQVLTVLEMSKAMGLVSCQLASQQRHLETYERRNNGSAANWWQFRSQVLGYSPEELRERAEKSGRSAKGKSQRQLLMATDKYEMIRSGVIDLLMAMGKTERFAKNLGDLAKVFARELRVDIFDDRPGTAPSLLPDVNRAVVQEIKGQYAGGQLAQAW
jgi:phage anti-repressor protein